MIFHVKCELYHVSVLVISDFDDYLALYLDFKMS